MDGGEKKVECTRKRLYPWKKYVLRLPYILVVNSYLSQALLGFGRNLTHLDGHIIELQRHGVTQPGNLI